MKFQTKYYILGNIFLVLAMFLATLAPIAAKTLGINYIETYSYVALKLLFLIIAATYYLFSPRYYKFQVMNIFSAILFYFIFVKFFNLIF